MRISKEQLAFKALVVLDEAIHQSYDRPTRPNVGVRLALSYLYAVSDRDDRKLYDDFWRRVRDPQHRATSVEMGRYMRSSSARSALEGIARGVGITLTPELDQKLREAHLRVSKTPS
jgi:hypothetical protein